MAIQRGMRQVSYLQYAHQLEDIFYLWFVESNTSKCKITLGLSKQLISSVNVVFRFNYLTQP